MVIKFKWMILLMTLIFILKPPIKASTMDSNKIECHNNYKLNVKFTPHHYTSELLMKLSLLSESNKPMEGWDLLGQNGDAYAKIAFQVLNPKAKYPFSAYRKLIVNHWINSAGERNYLTKFNLVALQHFRQYVAIILRGGYPDSDQVFNSYIHAVRSNGLEDSTVFDAVWGASSLNRIETWQTLNKLEGNRLVYPSRACNGIPKLTANFLIKKDFKDTSCSLIQDLLTLIDEVGINHSSGTQIDLLSRVTNLNCE